MRAPVLCCLIAGLAWLPQARAEATLRPGDTFELRVGGIPIEYTQEVAMPYTIADDGLVKLPYVGSIQAGGFTATQLSRTLEQRYISAKIFSSPTISITLPLRNRVVTVGGAVRTPAAIPWTSDLTLTGAVVRAGGDDGFTKGAHTAVVREGRVTYYDLRHLLKDPSANPRLRPGDEIRVD